jgi:P27 family predicted phage terminase small subunit
MKKPPTTITAPRYLRASTRRWWTHVVETWTLETHHVMVLTAAAEAWDRLQQARAIIAREGIAVKTRDGQKVHPAIQIERDSRLAFLRALRELDLDVQAPADFRRPPMLRSIAGTRGS